MFKAKDNCSFIQINGALHLFLSSTSTESKEHFTSQMDNTIPRWQKLRNLCEHFVQNKNWIKPLNKLGTKRNMLNTWL